MTTTSSTSDISINGVSKHESPVVIIGAGVSGICIAIDLVRRLGTRSFIILEKSTEAGGTWADNRYPGCRCDVSSHAYSYSFEPNPNWSDKFSPQAEILEYVVGVAAKWRLYPHMRFNTEVIEARWDDEEKTWKVLVKDTKENVTYEIRAGYLVSAVGQLNIPHYPEIDGLDKFSGKAMHSARWDSTYSFEGKRVGVIGNGASAVQIIPEIVDKCKSITVYQRTPNWIVPRANYSYPSFVKILFRWIPILRSFYRKKLVDEREVAFNAIVRPDTTFNDFIKMECIAMMKRQLKNKPELVKKLIPDYLPGCKRIIPHDDYYISLDKPHVNLETTHIDRISEDGIITVDGQESKFDAIVLATGFRTVEFMHPINVFGVNGRSIHDIWKGGARAYLGVTVESLPNFAMAYGPNTNLGHNSVIMMIEAQSRYISALIRPVLRDPAVAERNPAQLLPAKATVTGKATTTRSSQRWGRTVILPKPEVVRNYNATLQKRLAGTTWGRGGCKSWYMNADGVITNNWCGTVPEYQKMLSKLSWDDYDVSGLSDDQAAIKLAGKTEKLGRVVEESVLTRLGLAKPLVILEAVIEMATSSIIRLFWK